LIIPSGIQEDVAHFARPPIAPNRRSMAGIDFTVDRFWHHCSDPALITRPRNNGQGHASLICHSNQPAWNCKISIAAPSSHGIEVIQRKAQSEFTSPSARPSRGSGSIFLQPRLVDPPEMCSGQLASLALFVSPERTVFRSARNNGLSCHGRAGGKISRKRRRRSHLPGSTSRINPSHDPRGTCPTAFAPGATTVLIPPGSSPVAIVIENCDCTPVCACQRARIGTVAEMALILEWEMP